MKTYSVKEIAEMLDTNPETVRRWIRCGKLEAIQESRKSGNVVTDQMLDEFLKKSPKYARLVTGFLVAPLGLSAATAALFGTLLVHQHEKNEQVKPENLQSLEVIKLLNEEISSRKSSIIQKRETICQLQKEVDEECRRIEEAKKIICKLNEEVRNNA